MVTLSATTDQQAGEFNEILINRISPPDSTTLTGFNGYECLKGVRPFSRAYCENHYLLGRLHAIDRLNDIVCHSGRVDRRRDGIDIPALKKARVPAGAGRRSQALGAINRADCRAGGRRCVKQDTRSPARGVGAGHGASPGASRFDAYGDLLPFACGNGITLGQRRQRFCTANDRAPNSPRRPRRSCDISQHLGAWLAILGARNVHGWP